MCFLGSNTGAHPSVQVRECYIITFVITITITTHTVITTIIITIVISVITIWGVFASPTIPPLPAAMWLELIWLAA